MDRGNAPDDSGRFSGSDDGEVLSDGVALVPPSLCGDRGRKGCTTDLACSALVGNGLRCAWPVAHGGTVRASTVGPMMPPRLS